MNTHSTFSHKEQSLTDTSARSHPRRFDRDTYNQLTGLDARLLEAIDYDCRLTAARSPTRAKYSVKPEAYFAKILSVSRETISHHVTKLSKLGVLEVTHRNRVRGVWQTNMYRIRSWVWWRLAKLLRSLRSTPHRVKQPSHLSTPKGNENQKSPAIPSNIAPFVGNILARWKERGSGFAAT